MLWPVFVLAHEGPSEKEATLKEWICSWEKVLFF